MRAHLSFPTVSDGNRSPADHGGRDARARSQVALRVLLILVALVTLCSPRVTRSQEGRAILPFSIGERLTYRIRVGSMGNIGRGAMWVEGPVDVRGTNTVLLRFDLQAGVGPVKAVDRTSSWFDTRLMRSLRFWKHERHPLSKHDEEVELYPAQNRYEDEDGTERAIITDSPLDELSFMYFLRTLEMVEDSTYSFDRHFEAGRNPVTVRMIGRETLETAAGTFRTLIVEMRVRDPRRYRGEGIIRLNLTDDHCRLPVRIESAMPVLGKTVMMLERHTHGEEPCGDRAP